MYYFLTYASTQFLGDNNYFENKKYILKKIIKKKKKTPHSYYPREKEYFARRPVCDAE